MPFSDGLWLAGGAPDRRKRRRHRLKDIEVSEVSLVDRAANKRRFLVTKREDAMKKRKATRSAYSGTALLDLDGSTDFGKDPGHLKDEVAKGEAIPGPVKTAVQRALTEATERLMTVVQSVRGAEESAERAPRPLPESVGKEIMAVGALLQGVLRSYPSPVKDKDEEEKEKDEETEKSMSKAARNSVLDTLGAVNKRLVALYELLKQEEEEDEESDDEEMEEKDKSDDSEKDDEEKDKDADGEQKQDDEEEEEEEEKSDTEKSAAIAKELHGLSLMLGGALARVPTAKAVALVQVDATTTLEKDADGLVLHPTVKKALASGLEDALDALSGSLRDLTRMSTAKSDEVPDGYTLPEGIIEGAAKAGESLLTMGMEYGAVATGEPHDLDASLANAKQAAEDAKADAGEDEEEKDEEKDDAEKAKKSKKSKTEPDMAETIKDAVAAAMTPINARLDQIEAGVKKNAKAVKKSAGAKSAGNAVPAGTRVEKSEDEERDATVCDLTRMTPAKVAELKKEGLWF